MSYLSYMSPFRTGPLPQRTYLTCCCCLHLLLWHHRRTAGSDSVDGGNVVVEFQMPIKVINY
jgi:hypothetical protein